MSFGRYKEHKPYFRWLSAECKVPVPEGLGSWVLNSRVVRVQGSGFRVQGSGFRVQGLGFRV